MERCIPCNRKFKSTQHLEQHIQDSPVHSQRYECRSCNRSFKSEAALRQHIQNSTAHSPEHNPNSRNNSFKTDTHSHKGRWSMYPTHHESVSSLLQEDDLYFDFHDVDRAAGCINEYDTNIMGKFICDNKTCGTDGWSSKRIAITIRMYPREEYNARVYHQRCDGCGNLSRPVLNETYAERIVYRIKKWNGIAVDSVPYSSMRQGPHHTDLCEGCKAGHCKALA